MEKDFSNLDGEVINYDVMPGGATVRQNHFEDQDFYPADGLDSGDVFGEDLSFSRASGRGRDRRENRRSQRQTRKSDKNTRKNTRVDSKASAREMRGQATMTRAQAKQTRAEAKIGEAESQGRLAESLNDQGSSNKSQEQIVSPTTAASSSTTTTTPTGQKKLSTGAMIGIGVGAVVLIGIVYMMTKGKKSGK